MFPSQNIVSRPRFGGLLGDHRGGHLGFLTRSVVDNHFELDIKRGKKTLLLVKIRSITPGKKYIEIARGKCPDFRECIK